MDTGTAVPAGQADLSSADTAGLSKASFAGGPFWALEAAFEAYPGVHSVVTGYALIPGHKGAVDSHPDYEKVVEGGTGYCLAVEVRYDPKKVRYANLAHFYWRNIDPLAYNRQFSDSGEQFRTALFYRDSAQKRDATASLIRLQRGGRFKGPIAAVVEPAGTFLPAEEAQQDYYRKHPGRYRAWLKLSRREEVLERIWGSRQRVRALPLGK